MSTCQDVIRSAQTFNQPVPEDDYYPVLHFACHGLEDGTGIQLTSGMKLSSDMLRTVLQPIGKETGGKLLLGFSSCWGLKAEQMLPEKPEVFDVLVAPNAKLDPDEAVLGFAAFYHFFLTKGRTLRESVEYMNVAVIGSNESATFEYRPASLADRKFPLARRKDK